jgi:hypothetical protein
MDTDKKSQHPYYYPAEFCLAAHSVRLRLRRVVSIGVHPWFFNFNRGV